MKIGPPFLKEALPLEGIRSDESYVPNNVNAYGSPSFNLEIEEDGNGDFWRSSKPLYREHDLAIDSTGLLNLASNVVNATTEETNQNALDAKY